MCKHTEFGPDKDGQSSLLREIAQLRKLPLAFVALFSLFILSSGKAYSESSLPLFSVDNLQYKGAFRIPEGIYGESSMDYSEGMIAYNPDKNTMFMVGAVNAQAVAEFQIPELVNSTNISDLNTAGAPIQNFSRVLNRASTSNTQSIDRIGGMAYVDGQLIINGYEYYDAPADNTHTTLILRNANDLANSSVHGYFELDGRAHAAGWISPVPSEWESVVGGTHISGQCGLAITTRLSVGPSAFGWTPAAVPQSSTSGNISATTLLDFPYANPLNSDLYNESLNNDIWNHLSRAVYGFIVPGTRTYATFGHSGGHEFGLGYKIEQDTGYVCGGPCSYIAADNYNFYWLWDMNDLEKVRNGEMNSYDVKPYDYGPIDMPFGVTTGNKLGGGTFDPATGTLYMTVQHVDRYGYFVGPVVTAFQFDANPDAGGGSGSTEEPVEPEPPVEQPLALASPPSNLTISILGGSSGGSSGGDSGSGSGSDGGSTAPADIAMPVLPEPTGRVVNVSNASELANAISGLQANDTIILAAGQYNLQSTLYIGYNNVTIKGGTGNSSDVELIGNGMENANYGNVPHGIWTNASDLTVAHLTIKEVYQHGIIFNPGAENPHILNVQLLDTGTQFIKANPVAYGDGVDNGIVEFSTMAYTVAPPNTDHGGGTGYTNGVDVHAGQNWLIRHNTFSNFHTPDTADNLWAPAILMWNGAQGTISENNTFINVDRAIAYGLLDRDSAFDHSGGIIRNNMVYYSQGLYSGTRTANSDAAIIIWNSPQTKVVHNTVITNSNVNNAIEFRFDTTGAEAINNLMDGTIGTRNSAVYNAYGNYFTANESMFVDASSGDLHLNASATAAIDQVTAHVDAGSDFDQQARPSADGAADIGADER